VGSVEKSDDECSGEGAKRRGAGSEERKEWSRLLIAGRRRRLDSDRDFVGEQDPERLEQDLVEGADARQKRRQHDDGDAEAGDRPVGPEHGSPPL
jgi:hypothetical protein